MQLQRFYSSATARQAGLAARWFAIVCVVAVIEWSGLLSPVRQLGELTLLPMVHRVAVLYKSLQEPLQVLLTRGVSMEEHSQLQSQYAQALVRISELENVETENAALRAALDSRLPDQQATTLAAPILTADGTYIHAGSADGIQEGSAVLAEGILVGFVREQTPHQSYVMPVHRLSADEPILVKTEQGAKGLVYGNGKQVLLREVSRDGALEEGDRVLTAGQEGVRAGMVVGTVREIEHRPSAPTLSAILDQPVSLYEVVMVEVW